LDLPEPLLGLLAPRPPGYRDSVEAFRGATAPAFDALGAAATAADFALDLLRRDPALPGLDEVLSALVARVSARPAGNPRRAEIARAVESVAVAKMIELAGNPRATPQRARTVRTSPATSSGSSGGARTRSSPRRRFRRSRPASRSGCPRRSTPAREGSDTPCCAPPSCSPGW